MNGFSTRSTRGLPPWSRSHSTERICQVAGYQVEVPFPRLTYAEAMRSYGTDKPDRRIPPMHPVTDQFPDGSLSANGLPLVAIRIPNTGAPTRRERDELKAYGAEMVFSDPEESSDGAIRLCRQIYQDDPDAFFYPDQYNNPANWKAHFNGTGREIIEQTGGTLTHFVASMGTSGTFTGVTRRLRRDLPEVKCWPLRRTALCKNMKLTRLEDVRAALEGAAPEISMPDTVAVRARQAIDRMMAV